MVSLISRVGFLHIEFSKYVHWRKSLTENQEPALHETRTQSLGTANIKWHKELYIEKQNHERYSTPVKNVAKTRKNHLLPHKRIKCAVHLLYSFLKSWTWCRSGNGEKDGHFVRGNTLNMQKFDSQFQGLESRFGWAELLHGKGADSPASLWHAPETHRLHFHDLAPGTSPGGTKLLQNRKPDAFTKPYCMHLLRSYRYPSILFSDRKASHEAHCNWQGIST